MPDTDQIPEALLKRKAVVYVRQSTQSQVMANLESQRRQYDLVDIARRHGLSDVEVIDDDLGRSASGTVARPGLDRLVAWLCAGAVGAVICFDASRLARNGRDWHHLLELCGLVEARVIDHDGVYNPCLPNDRLLLGMKGSISEFELGIIRAGCLRQPGRRPNVASYAYQCRLVMSGIAKPVWAWMLTCVCKVAAQLEKNWECALRRVRELENRQNNHQSSGHAGDLGTFADLADNLSVAWKSPGRCARASSCCEP